MPGSVGIRRADIYDGGSFGVWIEGARAGRPELRLRCDVCG
ncbi:MAG: hypothetical protein ACKPJD_39015 [Planctomycetaceae bacterium]